MMIVKLIFGAIKPLVFIYLAFIYGVNFYGVYKAYLIIAQSTFPYKFILFFGVTLYLIHLILIFLLQKIYLKKNYISSMIWSSFITFSILLFFSYLIPLIYNSDFILFDFAIDENSSMLNYSIDLKEIKTITKITIDEMFVIKKVIFIYYYLVLLFSISNILLITKLLKNRFNNF